MIRRYGDSIDPNRRYIIRPGAYAILPHAGKLLVTYQGAPHWEFQLPGGGIDTGETAIQALHREVFEETGWNITRPRRLGAFRRFVYMPEYDIWAEKLCHIYLAQPVRQKSNPSEPAHLPALLSIGLALSVLANDGDRAFVKKYLA